MLCGEMHLKGWAVSQCVSNHGKLSYYYICPDLSHGLHVLLPCQNPVQAFKQSCFASLRASGAIQNGGSYNTANFDSIWLHQCHWTTLLVKHFPMTFVNILDSKLSSLLFGFWRKKLSATLHSQATYRMRNSTLCTLLLHWLFLKKYEGLM